VGDLQVVLSHTSPSVEHWASQGIEQRDYLPLDTGANVTELLDSVQPSVLVFARGDLWPGLVEAAARRHIPVAILGGTVRPRSLRLRQPIRSLYAATTRRVSWIGAATARDRDRWITLGAGADVVTTTGDPRHDQVVERLPDVRRLAPLAAWARGFETLIAGSVETQDLEVVCAAAAHVLHEFSQARLVIVPHDVDGTMVRRTQEAARRHGVAAQLVTDRQSPDSDARVVILAVRGCLADAYGLASCAYVGGGFRRARLHAVAEPAAYALPIVVGPEWRDSEDAVRLIEAGGAVALSRRSPVAALVRIWRGVIDATVDRAAAGLRARSCLTTGAARESANRVAELVKDATGPPRHEPATQF
jgi:3-deoxy-D-manno-octulosonic-acid transferase